MNTFYKHIYLLSNLCSDSIGFFLSLVKYLLQLLCLDVYKRQARYSVKHESL